MGNRIEILHLIVHLDSEEVCTPVGLLRVRLLVDELLCQGEHLLDLPFGQTSEARWQVTAPPHMGVPGAQEITWKISAKDENGSAGDALKVSQRVVPAVPVTVQQATLVQLEALYSLPVAPPADALPGRGGLCLA